jgi:hypothetical protein
MQEPCCASPDNGRGLTGTGEGAGTRGMRERAVLIGAYLTDGPHSDEDPACRISPLVRLTCRVLPTTNRYVDNKLFTHADGKHAATPLFVVFVAIGSTDLLFALDSIPGGVRRHLGSEHRFRS